MYGTCLTLILEQCWEILSLSVLLVFPTYCLWHLSNVVLEVSIPVCIADISQGPVGKMDGIFTFD